MLFCQIINRNSICDVLFYPNHPEKYKKNLFVSHHGKNQLNRSF
ncbi:Uncharacterized protein dnm_012940 [Desulfonema magnum]|uniref:Uncharacterized protein n=1 Tax=Desulfonema magnum TaxID=45655 RepID=A0A975GL48_9BACT|nr:Uncharacterized protein dnm_012940 [Desulfonema magnum]